MKINNVIAYQLGKNYTSHCAIFAGLSVAKGDCVVSIPNDEQQPYEVIVEMFKLWKNENKIFIPFRKNRNHSALQKFFLKLILFLD